jgi:Ca2+-binding RTX toxin-like protein
MTPRLVTIITAVFAATAFLPAASATAVAADDMCFGKPFTIDARGTGQTPIVGTEGPDVIVGGTIVYGLGGNDRICSSRGADVVYGGPGNDMIDGGSQEDFIEGGRGDDFLRAGLDTCYCDQGYGPGGEVLSVRDATGPATVDLSAGVASGRGIGHDTLSVSPGTGWWYAGVEFSEVHGSPYADVIIGGNAWNGNALFGFGGHDRIRGGDQRNLPPGEYTFDHLVGGAGNDRLRARGGADLLEGNRGKDVLNGGDGGDDHDVARYATPATVNWNTCRISGDEGTDRMIEIEAGPAASDGARVIGSPPC